MTKLGLHSETLTPAAVALIQTARPAVLVTLDLDPGQLAAIRPYVGLLIGRYDPNGDTQARYLGRGAELGALIRDGVAGVAHLLDGVTALNEPDVSTPERAAVVSRTLVDACTLLHAAGLKVVGGNFSAGTPHLATDPGGPAILDALTPGLMACDWIGLHEYSAPSMRFEAGYLCGRYGKLLDALGARGCHVPALMTECGVDFGRPDAPSGYIAGGVSDDAYLADLQWYAALLEAAPRVVAAAVFEAGSYDQFASFDVARTGLGMRLAQWMGQQSRQDGPTGPIAPTVGSREGHTMPGPLFHFDQGAGTLDCWVRCIQAFFLRYGYPLDVDTVFQAGKGRFRPPGGEAATFAEMEHAIRTLAGQLGVTVQLAEFDAPSIVLAALQDPNVTNPWTVIAGVAEQDLQPGQNYGHFLILSDLDKDGAVEVIDSLAAEDGNSTGKYPWAAIATAMIASWEPAVDAIGVKIVAKAA